MNIFKIYILLILFSAFLFAQTESLTDVFGIQKLYPTKANSIEWNSLHWANGSARFVDWSGDIYDSLNWTDNHSGGNPEHYFKIDGAGVLQMLSSAPRFHINSQNTAALQKQFFRDVEFTGYFRASDVINDAPDYGGMVVGVRSGALAHASSGGNVCNASTYCARFRHDGKWDFEKEWKHPGSYYQSSGIIGMQTPLFGGEKFPVNRWIGMKFVVYNKENETVKLELYIDSLSNGVVENSVWELVGEALDEGLYWSGAGNGASLIEGCADYNGLENAYAPILEGNGTVLMRTDGAYDDTLLGEYKYVSVREIDASSSFEGTFIRKNLNKKVTHAKINSLRFDLLGRINRFTPSIRNYIVK